MSNITNAAFTIITTADAPSNSVLKISAKTVQFPLSDDDINLIRFMKAKLFELGGVGLAAPQVNYSKQIAVIYIPEEAALLRDKVSPYPMHVIINARYENVDNSKLIDDFESCYSVSDRAGRVPRYSTIKLSYYDESGKHHESLEKDFYARVLQHEIDHLNGILITDRLTSNCVQGSIQEMMNLRRELLPPEKKILFDEVIRKKLRK